MSKSTTSDTEVVMTNISHTLPSGFKRVIKVNTIKQLEEAVRALNGEGGIIELHEGIYEIEGIEDER